MTKTVNKNTKRLYILDTNVIMHDPTSLFRFSEHDIYLPMVVLEELDAAKKGVSELARNVRQASRFLDELIHQTNKYDISKGVPLSGYKFTQDKLSSGRLHFQTETTPESLPASLPGTLPDNQIIGIALALKHKFPDISITIVSKDINLRLKAAILGLNTEDYHNDKVLDDVNLLFAGTLELDKNFWDEHSNKVKSWKEKNHTFYEIQGPSIKDWLPNQFLHLENEKDFNARVIKKNENTATLSTTVDYTLSSHSVWSITARNREQSYALNLLLDPNVDFVSLVGVAGTGKTLLTLAAALAQTLEDNIYQEIIMTRVTVPIGEDIGFLPGTEEEKMTPWMGALMDNLEVLTTDGKDNWTRQAANDLLQHRIKIRSLNFMRGRTFLNRFIILDEAQNLTSKQMKTLITRAGPGSKIVCLGNVAQIDTPYLTETTSGLTYAVDRFKNWEFSGHVTLKRGERSRLADFANENL